VFPDSVSREPVPQGKVVVGGANFETYAAIAEQELDWPRRVMDPQGNIQIIGFDRRHNRFEYMWADPSDLSYLPLD
jgi:hypothetical protein